jgi:hypothetical protein
VAEDGDATPVLHDSLRVDNVVGEHVEVGAPGGSQGGFAGDRRLVEDMQDVVFGHEGEQAFEVCVVDAVDEGKDESERRQRPAHGAGYTTWDRMHACSESARMNADLRELDGEAA